MNLASLLTRRETFDHNDLRVFTVADGGTLSLRADLGSLEVEASDSGTLLIEVFRQVEADDPAEAAEKLKDVRVIFTAHGAEVFVNAERLRRHAGTDLRFRISAPRNYNFDLQTAAGSISVVGVHGCVRARTGGGSLHFKDIRGAVFGQTKGGGIEVADASGPVEAHTLGGSISVELTGEFVSPQNRGDDGASEVSGGGNAAAAAGDTSARAASPVETRWHLTTGGGHMDLRLGEGVAVCVDAQTKAGIVTTTFPVSQSGDLDSKSLRAGINGGGPKMFLRTSAGDIRLKKI